MNVGGYRMKKKKQQYMTVDDVQEVLGCSRSHAFSIIHQMNDDLKVKGFLTIRGKVPTSYFAEKWYGFEK